MDRSSQGSERFRDSTHLIPSPGSEKKRPKRYEPLVMNLWVVLITAVLMMALGVGLEVGLRISNTNNGFSVPRRNVFTIASTQFLLSFFPTLFVIPLAFMWRTIDWMVRWYQPYVVLSRGNATAEESLLLDYVAGGIFPSFFKSLSYKHRIVFVSAITATATYIFQPLAGAIFQLQLLPKTEYSNVVGTRTIGLVQDVGQLNDFVAAAGFAEAAVALNLTDPPFVNGGWAAAEFVFPTYPGYNGSMTVNTTGIQTASNCLNSKTFDLNVNQENNFTITATSVGGCPGNVSFNPSTSNQQYGVVPVLCPGSSPNITFQPVMFWFFHLRTDDNTPQAKSVFCTPSIKVFNIMAAANLDDGSLANVTKTSNYTTPNNVTGNPINGQAINGVQFDFGDTTDPFVQARANVISSAVSGAIFRLASQSPGGLQSQFDLPNGLLDLTSTVYTRHLSVIAKLVYFVADDTTLPSALTSYVQRLWIDPLPGHALAVFLFLVGFVGIIIHILGRRERRNLNLTAPPGSIAAVVSLTSRSGFGELLLPYDDEKTLEHKLSGLKFRLDRRTGAIVADEYGGSSVLGPEDAMLSLLGQGHKRVSESSDHEHSNSSSVSHLAAAGYPPWVLKTPYDPV